MKRRLRELAALGLAALSLSSLYAQSNPQQVQANTAAEVRALGQRVVGRARSLADRQEVSSLITARAQALRTLIASDPAKAVEAALPEESLAGLRVAYPELREELESRGRWQGETEYLIADDFANSSSQHFIRIKEGSRNVSLHFANAAPLNLKSGDLLSVQGLRVGDHIAVSSEVIIGSPLEADNACSPIGEQRIAVIMVTFPGLPTPNLTAQQVRDTFFSTTAPSLDGYWREASYDQVYALGEVFGWYTLDRLYSCEETEAIRLAAMQLADADVHFPNYNRIFIVLPRPPDGCPYTGRANVGCGTQTSPDGTFTASTSWLIADGFNQGLSLAAHEGGHNLGLHHASSRDYGAFTLGAPGDFGMHIEYGDPFSAMGSFGSYGHYSARHKFQLGWLDEGSDIETVEGGGTFILRPLSGAPIGPRALRIRRIQGQDSWIWAEYRQPVGLYDSQVPEPVFGGALFHIEDENNLTGSGTPNPGKTHLLDFTPESHPSYQDFEHSVLPPGVAWQDPFSSLSLEVLGVFADSLVINVNEGSPCVVLDSEGEDFDYHAAGGTVNVSAAADCSWTVQVSSSWINVTSETSGQGPAVLTYAIDANAALPRSGLISVGGTAFTISQSGFPTAPSADSVTPATGSGGDPFFELRFSDGNGAGELSILGFIVNTGPTAVQGCQVEVAVASRMVRLANDAGNGWLGPVPIELSHTLSNSRCRVAAVLPPPQGTTRQLFLGIQFTPVFTATANLYLFAEDVTGLNTGWQNRGSWTVPVNHVPAAVSASPNAGSGYSQQLSLVFSDANGADDLRSGNVYLSQCQFRFTLSTPANPFDQLYLQDGAFQIGGLSFGSYGTIEHDQCGVNMQHSSVTKSGSQLIVRLDVFFKPGSEGVQQIQTSVKDSFLASSGWQPMGTWTVGPTPATTGVFRPSNGALFLKSQNTAGFADRLLTFGLPGDKPVTGDWNGDGIDTIGVFRNGIFYLRNSNTNGFADLSFGYGVPTDLPIVGDWNGDGIDTIGLFRNGVFYLRNSNSTGAAEAVFGLGVAGDIPISGDWNGDGVDTVGIFRPSNGALYLKNQNSTGFADIVLTYGLPGDKPVTGDWDGNGTDTIGVFRNGIFLLRNSNTNGFAEIVFGLGVAADEPISGIWGPL